MSNPIPFSVALQDSPETVIQAASPTTDLGSVNSNLIYMSNPSGKTPLVKSFGKQLNTTWEIRFDPGITIQHHPPQMNLISLANRTTVQGDAGKYRSDANGNIVELSWGSASTDDIASLVSRMTSVENRCTSLENRATNLEARATAVESRCTSLESRCTTLESEVATLQSQMATVTNWMTTVINTGLTTNGYVNANGNIYSTAGNMSVNGTISVGGGITVNGSINGGASLNLPNGSIDIGGNFHAKGQVNVEQGVTAAYGTAQYVTLTGHTHPYNPPNVSTSPPNVET
jgi:uncharacterized coiled-coil protein SlyX